MQWLLRIAPLVLAAFATGAGAEPRVAAGSDAARPLPWSAAAAAPFAMEAPRATPVPTATLPLLPPGVRTASEREALLPLAGAFVERVEDPEAEDWLDVEYTVRPELDARVRGVLEQTRVALGHVVMLDPASGEVYSYVSSDPERFPPTRAYPAASLMKVVTTAATLRNAPEALGRDCRYVGSPYRLAPELLHTPAEGTTEDFPRALAISNNQCFARLAVDDVGEEALVDELERIGLLEPPAPNHSPGRVDPVEDAFDLGLLGSGLSGSFVTPLGAARLAALLAEGELIRPYWIARIRDEDGGIVDAPQRREPRRVWSADDADELRELLVGVTTGGTARRAFVDESGGPRLGAIRVAGKTGTLSGDDPEGRYEWFIGVAPADDPRIAIAAVVVSRDARRGVASQVAATTLAGLFCADETCDAARVEPLLARPPVLEPLPTRPRVRRYVELDDMPRPVGKPTLEFPRRLLRRKVEGEVVLLLTLDAEGEVLEAAVDSSDLPEFEDFVLGEVRGWRFTPPRYRGRPVASTARLPIPIRIR